MRVTASLLCIMTGVSLSHCDFGVTNSVHHASGKHQSDGGMDADARGPNDREDTDPDTEINDEGGIDNEPAACTEYDYDRDGLQAAVEQDAGLDPCKRDTDSDGCDDGLEHYLGGCDPRNTLQSECGFEPGYVGQVSFLAPQRASGNWPHLNLRADRKDVLIQFDGANDAAVKSDASGFINVPVGTKLTFSVWFNNPNPGDRVNITLVDQDGVELDHGTVVFVYVDCPIVI